MTSLKILQYNTDNLRHGWEYFKRNVEKADIAVLQRFPKNKKSALMEIMSGCRSYMVESCPPLEMGLAIARNRHAPAFSGVESITLPSAQHVMAIGDSWQGCTALKTVISGVNIISFLPCYKTEGNEFPLSEGDTKIDVRFLLDKFKDTPTIIMGDFHVSPQCEWLTLTLETYNFKSYLDKYKTFRGHDGETYFNLDKCISNIDIELTDVRVDDVQDAPGHQAITYTLSYSKDK
jgi:hypothetical protein